MIESNYWRDELKTDLSWLRAKQKYKRWSEKQVVLFERKLMLIAFQINTLLIRPKVNEAVKAMGVLATSYPKVSDPPFATADRDWSAHFDLASPEEIPIRISDVCHQLSHSYWMSTFSNKKGEFTSVLVFEESNACAYEFPVSGLIGIFDVFKHQKEDEEEEKGPGWIRLESPRG